jgi:hypothetical protein
MSRTRTVVDSLRSTMAFLASAANNEVVIAYPTSTTETYTFSESGVTLYVITITYSDSSKEQPTSIKRTT